MRLNWIALPLLLLPLVTLPADAHAKHNVGVKTKPAPKVSSGNRVPADQSWAKEARNFTGRPYRTRRNCDDARAAGAAALRPGDAGYDRSLDRDGDGVACERRR